MTVDLSRLDEELVSLSVDQVAVARGMLAAREWAGRTLSDVDAALASLGDGASIASATGAPASDGLSDLFDDEPLDVGREPVPADARSIASDLAAALDDDDDLEATLGLSSPPPQAAELDDEDDLLDLDELEIVEDDDLLAED